MYSFDVFSELPAGTQFIIGFGTEEGPKLLVKLAPYGGDVGYCNLVNVEDGTIIHAYDIWNMRQYKLDLEVCDIASFDPKHDQVVEVFDWEKDLVPEIGQTPRIQALNMCDEGTDVPTGPDSPVLFFSDDEYGTVYFCTPQETLEEINERLLEAMEDEEPEEGI